MLFQRYSISKFNRKKCHVLFITNQLIIKVIFVSYSISSGVELWSVNNTSINENSALNFFEKMIFLGVISNIWPNDLFEIDVKKINNKISEDHKAFRQ